MDEASEETDHRESCTSLVLREVSPFVSGMGEGRRGAAAAAVAAVARGRRGRRVRTSAVREPSVALMPLASDCTRHHMAAVARVAIAAHAALLELLAVLVKERTARAP